MQAGTCPETALPLLLTLPLEYVIAIGDHKQLQPFSHVEKSSHDGQQGRSGRRSRGAEQVKVCYGFLRTGFCRFGTRCKFSHKPADVDAGHKSQGAAAAVQAGAPMAGESVGFFQRLERALPAGSIHALREQYRMHPAVCNLVSDLSYDKRLLTPDDVQRRRRQADPRGLYFLDVKGAEETGPGKSTSHMNSSEVDEVFELLLAGEDWITRNNKSVMIITFYRGQLFALLDRARAIGLWPALDDKDGKPPPWLRILTVDQSQV